MVESLLNPVIDTSLRVVTQLLWVVKSKEKPCHCICSVTNSTYEVLFCKFYAVEVQESDTFQLSLLKRELEL